MTQVQNPQPTTGQMIVDRLESIEQRLDTMSRLANLLVNPLAPEGEGNFFENSTRLLQMIVDGMEATHGSLQEVHNRLAEPGIARALERAIREN